MLIKQPRNVKQDGVSLIFNNRFSDTRSKEIKQAQVIVDNEVIRLSAPYMPFDTGTSQKLFVLRSTPGTGELKTGAPYDKKNYYNPQLNFQGAPLRGAFWFERMKTSFKDYIRKQAGKVIR